jgi:hypothetical protein
MPPLSSGAHHVTPFADEHAPDRALDGGYRRGPLEMPNSDEGILRVASRWDSFFIAGSPGARFANGVPILGSSL